MIVTKQKPIDDQIGVLLLLQESPFEFYPTGSRFFGKPKDDSDYDFYAEDGSGIRASLITNGFRECRGEYAEDPNISKVYRKHNIDIQLVPDVALKTRVQDKLLPILRSKTYNKVQARLIWQIAYQLLS